MFTFLALLINNEVVRSEAVDHQYIECLSADVPCTAKVGVGTGLSLAAIVCPSVYSPLSLRHHRVITRVL